MVTQATPNEFAELEERLHGRAGIEPTGELRERIMRAVEDVLADVVRPALVRPDQPLLPGKARRGNRPLWSAIAAAVLIAVNLSMICASHDEFSISPAPSPQQLNAEFQALHQIQSQQEEALK